MPIELARSDSTTTATTPPEILGVATVQPAIRIHWLYQILRGYPPQQVFAQTLLGFEVASADPDVVGINFVMPEDGYLSMRDYHLQMQMLDYLHSVYPKVHISLHAGELAPGMVPPAGLSFHIREAIDLGHAQRIGHGVDVLYEDHPEALLKQMAAQHIMVEINLTSNAGILGIEGKAHPLHAYMAAHVPWALSTDDEGVSRIDLTHEYVRAVDEQSLTYLDLKRSARTSLEHAFLHGQSLWSHPDDFAHRISACAAPITATSKPSTACAAFLRPTKKPTPSGSSSAASPPSKPPSTNPTSTRCARLISQPAPQQEGKSDEACSLDRPPIHPLHGGLRRRLAAPRLQHPAPAQHQHRPRPRLCLRRPAPDARSSISSSCSSLPPASASTSPYPTQPSLLCSPWSSACS